MTGISLTPIQSKALAFIQETVSECGVGPSYEEIMVALDLKSKSPVHRIVGCLEERGHIYRLPRRARSITLGPKPKPTICQYCGCAQ